MVLQSEKHMVARFSLWDRVCQPQSRWCILFSQLPKLFLLGLDIFNVF